MGLKVFSIRLEKEEHEQLKKYLDESGDSELNIGFVLRHYICSLNKAIPFLKRSDLDARANLSMYDVMMQNYAQSGQFHRIDGSESIVERLMKKPRKDKKWQQSY